MGKYISIFVGLICLALVWVAWPDAAVNLPHSLKNELVRELKSNTDPFTTPQTFDSGVTIIDGKLYLPGAQDDPTTPTLAFGPNHDMGPYSRSATAMGWAIIDNRVFTITATGIAGASGGELRFNQAPSATNPTVLARVGDTNSGLASAAADQVDMVGGGLNIARFDGTGTDKGDGSGTTVFTAGGIVVGDISGATITTVGGATAFVTILNSGVTPATPTESSTQFAWAGTYFTISSAGTVNQLGQHDPKTNEIINNSFNVDTGKGVRINFEQFMRDNFPTYVVDFTVDKSNWKVAQVAKQKARFIHNYIKQPVEVPPGQATAFQNIEVNGVGGVTKYKFKKGQVMAYWARNKTTVQGPNKEIKVGHWLNKGDGKFYRRRTRTEAIVAFVPPNDTSLGKLWDNLPPFLRADIDDPRL